MDHSAPRCLIVDDDESIRVLLRLLLAPIGGEIVDARSNEEAAEQLNTGPFAMIIADRRLQAGESGVEILRHARSLRPPPAMYLMSAHIDAEVRQEASLVGATPLDKLEMSTICDAWEHVLGGSAATDEPDGASSWTP